MNTTAVYIRVSTVCQNEAGQRQAVQEYLNAHHISDVEWFVDKASGKSIFREQFDKMQKKIFAGTIKTVIVWKLDRLSRNIRDGINVMDDWLTRGVRLISVTQQLDFNGAVGKLVSTVLLAVAEMENELRKERQTAGIQAAKASGKYKGRKTKTFKAAPMRALQLRAMGLTTKEIANILQVSQKTVYNYLDEVVSME